MKPAHTPDNGAPCSHPDRVASAAPAIHYSGYFEMQQGAFCGMHALNNLLGLQLYSQEDLERAANLMVVDRVYDESLENGEDVHLHIDDSGNYSSELLSWVLANSIRLLADTTVYEMVLSSLKDDESVFHHESVIGALQNRGNAHWVAVRKFEGHVWELDSLARPRLLSPGAFSSLVHKYPRTYAVRPF